MPEDQPLEVELKLVATADAMSTLLASPVLREHARSTVRSRNLVTTYYDTSDHRLSRRGLAFRVRQSGKKFIQTLKTASSGEGVEMTRGEWEVALADGTPQLTAFNDPRVLDLTGLVLPDELVPTFETRFKRQAVLIEWPDANRPPAQIEVAFDRGAIRANGSETPICEIELELKRGEPQGLVRAGAVAARPGAGAPADAGQGGARLWPGDGRAAGLAQGQADRARREHAVEDALQRILGGCVRHWIENEGATREARDPEGLHQLRVALRRLRSALGLFKTALGEQARASWNDELRWLLGPLGPARDLDVFATETMHPGKRRAPERPRSRDPGGAGIGQSLAGAPDRARDPGLGALRRPRLRPRLLGRAARLAPGCGRRRAAGAAATGPRIRRRHAEPAATAGAQARPRFRRAQPGGPP